jgi:hypothetical protein
MGAESVEMLRASEVKRRLKHGRGRQHVDLESGCRMSDALSLDLLALASAFDLRCRNLCDPVTRDCTRPQSVSAGTRRPDVHGLGFRSHVTTNTSLVALLTKFRGRSPPGA